MDKVTVLYVDEMPHTILQHKLPSMAQFLACIDATSGGGSEMRGDDTVRIGEDFDNMHSATLSDAYRQLLEKHRVYVTWGEDDMSFIYTLDVFDLEQGEGDVLSSL